MGYIIDIFQLKFEGFTNQEISAELAIYISVVERKQQTVRGEMLKNK